MHEGVLDKSTAPFFPFLKNFPDFYLGGGTALALQIGHRLSQDLDMFSDKPIEKKLLPKLGKIFAGRKIVPSVNTADELTILVDNTKITFLHYPFPVLLKLVLYQGVRLLSIKEIASSKMYTIGRRGEFKDYIDIYYILKEDRATLQELITLSQKKYGSEFNARLFLEQLVYLRDLKETEVIFLKEAVNKIQLQGFMEQQVQKLEL